MEDGSWEKRAIHEIILAEKEYLQNLITTYEEEVEVCNDMDIKSLMMRHLNNYRNLLQKVNLTDFVLNRKRQ